LIWHFLKEIRTKEITNFTNTLAISLSMFVLKICIDKSTNYLILVKEMSLPNLWFIIATCFSVKICVCVYMSTIMWLVKLILSLGVYRYLCIKHICQEYLFPYNWSEIVNTMLLNVTYLSNFNSQFLCHKL
jgi:hypothetical protein